MQMERRARTGLQRARRRGDRCWEMRRRRADNTCAANWADIWYFPWILL